MDSTGCVTMGDYRITIQDQYGSKANTYDNNSSIFHALCRAAEYCGRTDVKVTVELIKGNNND